MSDPVALFADPETSEEEIYRATWEALQAHGLTDLSIQRIADQTDLGKSTIYHHFEGKDDLLTSFVSEFMREHVDALVLQLPEDDMLTLFDRSLDLFILGEGPDGTTLDSLVGDKINDVYLQLRAHAATDPAYQSAIAEADAVGRERMVAMIESGQAEGLIRDTVDPERAAATIYAFVETALLVQSTSDDTDWLRHVRASADDYMADIVADGVSWPPDDQ
ncbi:TetR/AcrR family transcriptional regulator [Salinarchaeum sp. Harcht-Bsk1]|uniref:TetR/AcrR family transcriptional regulator n=1 Tax=Salinarchaeum sp. Harcht-Bsk1 TaxID=1333523 RepID=UPI001650F6B6|nr:TetR/AcrR family transcriptional regulator [Salinarchaeum sp. Harcht-Bsk1]